MPDQRKFHIWFGDSRTTITVDELLFELMAIKLKVLSDEEQAHATVREWLRIYKYPILGKIQAVRTHFNGPGST